jgi:hypothetical protein
MAEYITLDADDGIGKIIEIAEEKGWYDPLASAISFSPEDCDEVEDEALRYLSSRGIYLSQKQEEGGTKQLN